MSALDRSLREQTRQELLRIQRETGTTFVLVTHDQDEALAMATRIGLLHRGRLEQVGTPAEIYERPATRYVAAFMGGANILPATVREAGPPAVLEMAGVGTVQAAGAAPAGAGIHPGIHVALRPERLRLGGEGPNRAEGVVTEIAYRGDTVDVAVRLPNDAVLSVNRHLGDGAAAGVPQPGAAVTVSWSPDACVMLAS